MTKVDVSGESPKEVWSINLGRLRFYATLFTALAGCVLIGWASVRATGKTIFKEQLEIFHEKAMPAIEEMVDEKIERHQAQANEQYMRDLGKIYERLVAIETTQRAILREMEQKNGRPQ